VHVTYEAVDDRFAPTATAGETDSVRDKYGLPEHFLLYLGGAERRKNLATLVRAWAHAAPEMRRQGVKLVIVADFPPPDALYPDIPGLVGRLGITDDVYFVRQVHEEDKPALYRSAIGFCYPSRYEGFGFPPLEAMACGAPVLVANQTSLPEVVGDAGLLLPVDDISAWSGAMTHVVSSVAERETMRARGLLRAAMFSWQETARRTVAVYREVLAT
jgi:glycosyltransferase involved in cell wall biosynthesis